MAVDTTDLKRQLSRAAHAAMADAARETVTDLRHVLWRDTGDTAERTKVESIRTVGNTIVVTIMTPTPQAAYQEYGTRPHFIYPRRAKALRWVAKGGKVVFAKKVFHPGNRARPRFYPTIRDNFMGHLERSWRRLAP